MPLGHHVEVKGLESLKVEELCPMSELKQTGHVDFLVPTSCTLASMTKGEQVLCRAKSKDLVYHGLGYFEHRKQPLPRQRKLCYVVRGLEITLIYRLLLTSLTNEDEVQHWVIYTPGVEALPPNQLKWLAERHPKSLSLLV